MKYNYKYNYKYNRIAVFALLIFALMTTGCKKRYTIYDELMAPLPSNSVLTIGTFVDNLPFETHDYEKPVKEQISFFKEKLVQQIDKKDIFLAISQTEGVTNYELYGSILEYKEGSGAVRFAFGMFFGKAELIVSINLRETQTGAIAFSGVYTATVTSQFSKSDKMFETIAKDFAKSLQKSLNEQEG